MAPSIGEFSAIFIVYGGWPGIYDEYLYLKNEIAIVRKDFEFYKVKVLDKKIYEYIKALCKKKNFDFQELPLPTDMTSIKIIIQKPCNKEIEMYAVGFGTKNKDRVMINEIYNLSRNLKYQILKDTIPSKILIYYYKLDFFEKTPYIDLSEYELKDTRGVLEITNKNEILKVIEKMKNYYRGRFHFIKAKDGFYQARIEIKL